MAATIFDGNKSAEDIKKVLTNKVALQSNQQARVPHLAIVFAGDNPGSALFVRNIIKGGSDVGMRLSLAKFPSRPPVTEISHLLDVLANTNSHIDGIYIQLPLPAHLSQAEIIGKIPWAKDVGDLRLGLTQASVPPTTEVSVASAPAVLKILNDIRWSPTDKQVLLVGNTNLIKPLAVLLLDKKAIITMADEYSLGLSEQCRTADLIVSAVGKPNVLTGGMIKKDAVVIDAGYSLDAEGKPQGDVDMKTVPEVASVLSPIPNGVDAVYVALILENTWNSYLRRNQ